MHMLQRLEIAGATLASTKAAKEEGADGKE
jgi:hypothetical protein